MTVMNFVEKEDIHAMLEGIKKQEGYENKSLDYICAVDDLSYASTLSLLAVTSHIEAWTDENSLIANESDWAYVQALKEISTKINALAA